jgi:hypothetical protein
VGCSECKSCLLLRFSLRLARVLFSRIIIIIIFIFPISTSQLARRSTPQQLNAPAQKLYRRDQRRLCFRVTLSFPENFNFKFSLTSDLDRCSASQGTSNFVQFFLQRCPVSWNFTLTMSFWQTDVLGDTVGRFGCGLGTLPTGHGVGHLRS